MNRSRPGALQYGYLRTHARSSERGRLRPCDPRGYPIRLRGERHESSQIAPCHPDCPFRRLRDGRWCAIDGRRHAGFTGERRDRCGEEHDRIADETEDGRNAFGNARAPCFGEQGETRQTGASRESDAGFGSGERLPDGAAKVRRRTDRRARRMPRSGGRAARAGRWPGGVTGRIAASRVAAAT